MSNLVSLGGQRRAPKSKKCCSWVCSFFTDKITNMFHTHTHINTAYRFFQINLSICRFKKLCFFTEYHNIKWRRIKLSSAGFWRKRANKPFKQTNIVLIQLIMFKLRARPRTKCTQNDSCQIIYTNLSLICDWRKRPFLNRSRERFVSSLSKY